MKPMTLRDALQQSEFGEMRTTLTDGTELQLSHQLSIPDEKFMWMLSIKEPGKEIVAGDPTSFEVIEQELKQHGVTKDDVIWLPQNERG